MSKCEKKKACVFIGKGSYGKVYEDATNSNQVIKKIPLENYREYGCDEKILREISSLKLLQHCEYIVPLKLQTFVILPRKEFEIHLTFLKYKSDLFSALQNKQIKQEDVKSIMYQILMGLYECEQKEILHRDIKPQNIFWNNQKQVVIGDFGLARWKTTKLYQPFSNEVVTLNYRAPELLLGSSQYNTSIEVWSVGCLLYELWVGKRLFISGTEIGQLFDICDLVGSDCKEELKCLPHFTAKKLPKFEGYIQTFESKLPFYDLFLNMLKLNPSDRFTIQQCLQHNYFDSIRFQYDFNFIKARKLSHISNLCYEKIDVDNLHRNYLLDWLFGITILNDMIIDIFFLAVHYFDELEDLLSITFTKSRDSYLTLLCCLIIACKILHFEIFSISQFQNLCQHYFCSESEILKKELFILQTLDFNLFKQTVFQDLVYLFDPSKFPKKAICMLYLLHTQKKIFEIKQKWIHEIFQYFANDILSPDLESFLKDMHYKHHLIKMEFILCGRQPDVFEDFSTHKRMFLTQTFLK